MNATMNNLTATATTSKKFAFTYNHITKKIVGTDVAFAKAGIPGSALEKELLARMEGQPTYTFEVIETVKKPAKKTYAGLTQELMREYIEAQEEKAKEDLIAQLDDMIAKKISYPLHVGITESGTVYSGNIKSSVGLGAILYQGIGNTIRVSLSGDPVEEIKTAKLVLKTLGLRSGGIEVVSCPTCGRTQIDLIGLANQVEDMVKDIPLDIKVAVMGCVVNGPGEAKEADIGIAGGKGEGLLIKKGEIMKKVPENQLLNALRQELLNWGK